MAQGMAQCTDDQNQVWYHSAIQAPHGQIQADKMQASIMRPFQEEAFSALIPFVLSRPNVDLIRSKLVISLMYSRKLFDTFSVFKFKKIPHLQTRAQVH